MKKLNKVILCLCLLIFTVIGVAACNKTSNHVHKFDQKNTSYRYKASEATCTAGESYFYSCLCGEAGNESFELDFTKHNTKAVYTDENGNCHTIKSVCNDCAEIVSEVIALHTYEDSNYCSACEHRKKSGEFAPGLYESGTANMIYSWQELWDNGIIDKDTSAVITGKEDLLAGDLIIGKTERVLSGGSDKPPVVAQFSYANCKDLTGVYIPYGTSEIGVGAFYGCDSLTSISLPDTVKKINGLAFSGCNALVSVKLSSTVEIICSQTFNGLRNITEITIPSAVTQINEFAFLGCFNLAYINYEGTVEEWNAIKKDTYWASYPTSHYVVCSDGIIDTDGTVTYK